MWANAQRDGRPAEYRRRLLFNALYCLAHSSNVPYTAFSLQYITHPNLHSFSKAVIYGNTQFYLQTSHYMPLFPSRRASLPFGCQSFYRLTECRRLSRPGWLVTCRNKVPTTESNLDTVTHPSTNRAQRRLTSLMETNALPLRQTIQC